MKIFLGICKKYPFFKMKFSILILQKTPIKDHKGQKKERPKKGQKTNSPQEKKQINKN